MSFCIPARDLLTYPKASEAGNPKRGNESGDLFNPKSPVRMRPCRVSVFLYEDLHIHECIPMNTRKRPTYSWLSLPTVGWKGLLAAACQTSWRDMEVGFDGLEVLWGAFTLKLSLLSKLRCHKVVSYKRETQSQRKVCRVCLPLACCGNDRRRLYQTRFDARHHILKLKASTTLQAGLVIEYRMI